MTFFCQKGVHNIRRDIGSLGHAVVSSWRARGRLLNYIFNWPNVPVRLILIGGGGGGGTEGFWLSVIVNSTTNNYTYCTFYKYYFG